VVLEKCWNDRIDAFAKRRFCSLCEHFWDA
jgi:hypothetical protein